MFDNIAKFRIKVYGLLLLFTIIILALSAHVNQFQGFYYVADRFPFVMSLLTLLFTIPLLTYEFVHSGDVSTARPRFELAWLAIFLIVWTGANAFSTSRWQFVQLSDCRSIPVEEDPAFLGPLKTWCNEIQALRAFIWLEWVLLLLSFVAIFVFAIHHSRAGAKHVWSTPFSRFNPSLGPEPDFIHHNTDYFARDQMQPQSAQFPVQFPEDPQMQQHNNVNYGYGSNRGELNGVKVY